MCGYPQFSFWISITLVQIYISCIIISRSKNTFELIGTVLKLRHFSDTLKCPYDQKNHFLFSFRF